MTDETIRGHRLTDQESMALNMPDIPIWTDDGMIIAPISDNGTMPLDSAIESKIQLDAIAYRVTRYYKTHDEEIQKSDDDIDFVLRMIGKATGFIAEAGCSTGHVHTNTATEMQALSKIVWLTQQSDQCLLMAANTLINEKEHMLHGMTFEQAMAQMRAGKMVTRPKYREHTYFTIGEDEDYDHRFPCLLKHVLASKPNEPERWRAYIVSHITVHDIFATDWEVCDGSAV